MKHSWIQTFVAHYSFKVEMRCIASTFPIESYFDKEKS